MDDNRDLTAPVPPMPPVPPQAVDDEVDVEVSFEEGSFEDEPKGDKTNEELAREVLAGDWGKGQETRQRLAEAGYDHVKVRREVVRLLNETP